MCTSRFNFRDRIVSIPKSRPILKRYIVKSQNKSTKRTKKTVSKWGGYCGANSKLEVWRLKSITVVGMLIVRTAVDLCLRRLALSFWVHAKASYSQFSRSRANMFDFEYLEFPKHVGSLCEFYHIYNRECSEKLNGVMLSSLFKRRTFPRWNYLSLQF